MPDAPTTFSERLLAARAARRLSQADLARRAGIQPSALCHFETGRRRPSFDNLRRLADALGVTADYLLGRASDSPGLARADRLRRRLDRLSADDRDLAEDFIGLLAAREAGK